MAWQGMRRDEQSTGEDGTALLVNGRLSTDGELQRRRGYEKLGGSTSGGHVVTMYWHPVSGQWIIAKSASGALEATAV